MNLRAGSEYNRNRIECAVKQKKIKMEQSSLEIRLNFTQQDLLVFTRVQGLKKRMEIIMESLGSAKTAHRIFQLE
ncbi:hypothetical protein RB195_012681 [Necator americanus]|uniref:Uncharacterized protein n=1 Tax=Necator americanus TaxID=51031 RepID=A0ABR1DS40_NECAM